MLKFDHFHITILKPEETKPFFNLIDVNRASLEDFFAGTVSKTKTFQDTLNYCSEIQNRIVERSYFPYLISDTFNDRFVGLVDVKNIDWKVPKAELGYFIDSQYSGQGITSKALGLVIDHLIETYQFKKLLCRIGSQNTASRKVAENNGFTLEGTIRKDYRTTKGDIIDLDYFGRIF